MPIVILSERGQLVIPQQVRAKLDLRKGSRLYLEFSQPSKTITLRPLEVDQRPSLRGILKHTRALEMLEAEHRAEIRRDERRRRG